MTWSLSGSHSTTLTASTATHSASLSHSCTSTGTVAWLGFKVLKADLLFGGGLG